MAYQRQINRTDENQKELDAAARKMGGDLVPMTGDATIGFDRIYARAGVVYLVEVKDGAKTPGDRKLKPKEITRAEKLVAVGVTVYVVTSVQELADLLMDGRGVSVLEYAAQYEKKNTGKGRTKSPNN